MMLVVEPASPTAPGNVLGYPAPRMLRTRSETTLVSSR